MGTADCGESGSHDNLLYEVPADMAIALDEEYDYDLFYVPTEEDPFERDGGQRHILTFEEYSDGREIGYDIQGPISAVTISESQKVEQYAQQYDGTLVIDIPADPEEALLMEDRLEQIVYEQFDREILERLLYHKVRQEGVIHERYEEMMEDTTSVSTHAANILGVTTGTVSGVALDNAFETVYDGEPATYGWFDQLPTETLELGMSDAAVDIATYVQTQSPEIAETMAHTPEEAMMMVPGLIGGAIALKAKGEIDKVWPSEMSTRAIDKKLVEWWKRL